MKLKRIYINEEAIDKGTLSYIERMKFFGMNATSAFTLLIVSGAKTDPLHIGGPETSSHLPSPPRPSGPTEEQRAMQRAMRAKYEAEQAEKNKTKETP